MTFVEKHRFESARTERELMKIAWEGELFGVGLFETLAERFPQHADQLTACATMEWFNVHACEPLGHAAGVRVPLAKAEKLGREGAAFARSIHTFSTIAKLAIEETREVDPLFKKIS
ncbi:hypothetical protein, partial [Streptomyces virginiae]|uniref:hypothetical protein n=1 Tax=Streptomyces virginiae TaxID=1961 RepID=UPI003668A277